MQKRQTSIGKFGAFIIWKSGSKYDILFLTKTFFVNKRSVRRKGGAGEVPFVRKTSILLLWAVYGTLCCEITGGMTLGKYCGKMCVLDRDGTKPSIMYLGLRELTKAMYLQPLAGPVLMIVSLGMYLVRGVTLHDLIGRTRVVYLGQAKRIRAEQEAQYERER